MDEACRGRPCTRRCLAGARTRARARVARARIARVTPLAIGSGACAAKTRDGGKVAGRRGLGAGFRGRSRGVVCRHICTRAEQRLEDCVLISDGNGVVGSRRVGVDVGLAARLVDARGGIVAFDGDFLKLRVVVSVVLDVGAVPVDEPATPVDGSLAVGWETGGPEGELDTGWCLGEVVLVGAAVEGGVFFEGADDAAVDGPGAGVGFPVDFVGVPVVEGSSTPTNSKSISSFTSESKMKAVTTPAPRLVFNFAVIFPYQT